MRRQAGGEARVLGSSDSISDVVDGRTCSNANVGAFAELMWQWASTMIQSGKNLPFVLPLKTDRLETGFQVHCVARRRRGRRLLQPNGMHRLHWLHTRDTGEVQRCARHAASSPSLLAGATCWRSGCLSPGGGASPVPATHPHAAPNPVRACPPPPPAPERRLACSGAAQMARSTAAPTWSPRWSLRGRWARQQAPAAAAATPAASRLGQPRGLGPNGQRAMPRLGQQFNLGREQSDSCPLIHALPSRCWACSPKSTSCACTRAPTPASCAGELWLLAPPCQQGTRCCCWQCST